MNIVILAGGLSPERDVSLVSGGLIANALAARGHKVFMLDIYEGIEFGGVPPLSFFTEHPNYKYRVSNEVPDLELIRSMNGGRRELIGEGVIEICRAADIAFIALHGDMGENGQLQATLDNYCIKYTGSGYAGSLLAMDKDISKRLLRQSGVPTPDWIYYDTKSNLPRDIIDVIGLPVVVKPCACGSSVGVSIADTFEQLERAIKAAAKYERYLVVERKITGREFSVGILSGEALPAIEIIPKSGFFDYKNKYQSGMTDKICPAPLDSVRSDRIARYAMEAFRALRLDSYARIDFMLDDEDFWCLEANTLPGMSPLSLLPQEAAAAGIDYGRLCEIIATDAFNK